MLVNCLSISSCYKMTHEYRDPRIQGLVDRNYNDVLSWYCCKVLLGGEGLRSKGRFVVGWRAWHHLCVSLRSQERKLLQIFPSIWGGCQQVTRMRGMGPEAQVFSLVCKSLNIFSPSLSLGSALHSRLAITNLKWFMPLKCDSFTFCLSFDKKVDIKVNELRKCKILTPH